MTAVATKPETFEYTAQIAHAAREFARERGIPVGTRGRLSLDHFAKYFVAQPRTARQIAALVGVEVSKRGRLAETDAVKIAEHVR